MSKKLHTRIVNFGRFSSRWLTAVRGAIFFLFFIQMCRKKTSNLSIIVVHAIIRIDIPRETLATNKKTKEWHHLTKNVPPGHRKTKFNFLFACEQKQKPNGNDLPAIQIPATLRSYYHTSSTTFPQCNKRTSSPALVLCMFGVSVHEDIIKGKKNAYLSLNFIKKRKYYQHILRY